MSIAELCAQVRAAREHRAFLAACEEEYVSNMTLDDDEESEEESEEEGVLHVASLSATWMDVFCNRYPRSVNAFKPLEQNFVEYTLRPILLDCVRNYATEDDARQTLLSTWEQLDVNTRWQCKRITWASTCALADIFDLE